MKKKIKLLIGLSFGIVMVIIAIGIGSLIGMKMVSFISIDHQIIKYIVYGLIYYVSIAISMKTISAFMKVISMMKVARSEK